LDRNADKQLKPSGDLIPWTLGKYYLDDAFPKLAGARIVRISTHPTAQKMGYGTKAIQLLEKFFSKELLNADADLS
jgi:N-acetyltransferase 10